MTTAKPTLVVLGATGIQGGSVISHFLSQSPCPYALRAVTRNPGSRNAVSLAALGVQVVTGDFDNPSSLDAAFSGASAIFSVTDFWQAFTSVSRREEAATSGLSIGVFARDYETQQNKNIIDAAAKVPTLERFIFSGLPNSTKVSGGKYPNVYHFASKGIAEDYGRAAYPKLWEKTSVLYAGFYLENQLGPAGALFRPKLVRCVRPGYITGTFLLLYLPSTLVMAYYTKDTKNKNKDTLVLSLPEALAKSPLPVYSAVADTGVLVDTLLRAAPGKKIIGVNQWLSFLGATELLAQVLGKRVEFVDDRRPNLEPRDPDLDKDYKDMVGFCVEFGYDGGKVDKSILQPADLGIPMDLVSVKEWFENQDWESVLEIN